MKGIANMMQVLRPKWAWVKLGMGEEEEGAS
jgi:hypothetical protein